MRTIGIVAEYNPFHQGHIHQLQSIRNQADGIVVIITGFFSQRGLPSLLSLEDKTRLALKHGVDLVIELPACYGCQSADYFARYAIESLSQIHIDALCFGSEINDIQMLRHAVHAISKQKKDVTTSMNHNLNLDMGPNDILGMQYVKYCDLYRIAPIPIKRESSFKSATQTRNDYFNGQSQLFDSYFHKEQSWDSYYPYLRTFLLLSSPQYLQSLFMVNEGIEYRLIEAAKKNTSYNSFIRDCISKNYSKARIQRTLIFVLLQLTKTEMEQNSHFNYVKVAGFNATGQRILKENKGNTILTRFQDLPPFLQNVDLKTLALYNSVLIHPLSKREVIRYD